MVYTILNINKYSNLQDSCTSQHMCLDDIESNQVIKCHQALLSGLLVHRKCIMIELKYIIAIFIIYITLVTCQINSGHGLLLFLSYQKTRM